MENVQPCIDFLKTPREDASLDSAGRLFHSLAPRKEKHFCPFADLFFGNLKSVSRNWVRYMKKICQIYSNSLSFILSAILPQDFMAYCYLLSSEFKMSMN